MKIPTPKVPPDWRIALMWGLCFVLYVVLCTILILLYLWDRDRWVQSDCALLRPMFDADWIQLQAQP